MATAIACYLNAPLLRAQTTHTSASPTATPQQTRLPSFEAVSIKPESSAGMAYFNGDPGYEFLQRVSADLLIGSAYDLRQFQIVGLPKWAKDKNYDIETKTDTSTVAKLQAMPSDQRIAYHRLMFQSLLADRFKLRAHHVTVQANGYLLVVAKPGKLRADDCTPNPAAGSPCGGTTAYPGHIESKGIPITVLIRSLEIFTGSIVLDQTNLTAKYDVTLDWTPDPGQMAAPGIPVPPPDTTGPSLQTALKEALGLKLVSAKVPMDTIVIDHIEEPSPN
ncbi:MAG TPA: TIGR03435 family protein [Candidatus Aquilonibacter sp.]|nr:TIGR03435 family protein [Candidatus Aquilonibacter sp.]